MKYILAFPTLPTLIWLKTADLFRGWTLPVSAERFLTQPGASLSEKQGPVFNEYGAAMHRAVADGWLESHPSGAYVKLTQKGADRFA
jgi:hypothetical protein